MLQAVVVLRRVAAGDTVAHGQAEDQGPPQIPSPDGREGIPRGDCFGTGEALEGRVSMTTPATEVRP